MSLEWKVADESRNRFLEASWAEMVMFSNIRGLSLFGDLVKNEVLVKKH